MAEKNGQSPNIDGAFEDGSFDDGSFDDGAFEDGAAIDEALRQSARDARRLHKALGHPTAEWRNGEVVWIKPEDIVIYDTNGQDEQAR